MAGFIFGAGTPYKTHSDLQKQRAIADALASQAANGAGANTLPEGAANLGVGLVAALMKGRADRTEAAGRADFNSRFGSLTKSLLRGGKPSSGGSVASVSPDVAGGIKATAEALGIDPVDLGTAISYETAGTFDATKAGPTTKWGTHRGLIQFGEPQAAKYGVDWNDPVGSQLGPDGAVAKYLADAGVQPGMGLLDIYSAINAGKVGRYGASDAAAGGAPGTVMDKVRDQMAGHQDKARALLAGIDMTASPQMIQNARYSTPGDPARPQNAATGAQGGVVVVPTSAPPPTQEMPSAASPAVRGGLQTRNQRDGLAGDTPARQQAGQPTQGGGFFTSLLPMDAPPDQVATVQQAETSLGQMPIEQIADLASSPYAEPWQKNLMQSYLEHRMQQEFAPPPDPLDQRRKELEVRKLEQGLAPAPQARPATTAEKRAFGLPENAPVFIKPDGTPEILDTSKIGGAPGYRPATPEEKQQFGVAPSAPLVIGPDNKPSILNDGKDQGPQMSMTLPDGTTVALGNGGGGGSGALPAEVGARIGLGERFLQTDLPEIMPMIEDGSATGPIDYLYGLFGRGDAGDVQRRMATGADALRRGLTGAGMSSSESAEYAKRYLPQWSDDAETLKKKAIGLQADLEAVKNGAIAGKTGNLQLFMPGTKIWGEQPAAADPSKAGGPGQPNVRKYNPRTGKIE